MICGFVNSSEEFVEAVSTVLPQSGYVYCPGISVVAYKDYFEILHFHSYKVKCIFWATYWPVQGYWLPPVAQTSIPEE